jgi:intein-encoded DNA endonuclease-like protein
MSYVLGFWYADGNMRKSRSYRISFSSMDSDHLEAIRKLLKSNSPIFSLESKYLPQLTVRSKNMFTDLQKLGGIPAKSTRVIFPDIPENYLADFVRGYFDGDGSVHKITYKATKNGKFYTEIRSNFTCGSKKFLETLREILHIKLGLKMKVIGQYGRYQFKLGYGQKDTFKLMQFMYYKKNLIALRRKEAYLQLLKID